MSQMHSNLLAPVINEVYQGNMSIDVTLRNVIVFILKVFCVCILHKYGSDTQLESVDL